MKNIIFVPVAMIILFNVSYSQVSEEWVQGFPEKKQGIPTLVGVVADDNGNVFKMWCRVKRLDNEFC
ncbi:MAG: hypothetical protein ABI462_08570 [Ignavibacteria bacterium]